MHCLEFDVSFVKIPLIKGYLLFLVYLCIMNYEEFWQPLTKVYDIGEAKAIARMIYEIRYGLTLTDIVMGKADECPDEELKAIQERLLKGEPVQYIISVADFYGREFRVEPGVLIPRPETAELCEWILESKGERLRVGELCSGMWREVRDYSMLDIGTGSGCIAITLALEMPEAKVSAWDISNDALRIAEGNAKKLGAKVLFEKKDALNIPITSKQWDVIVSNPPYIQPDERDGMEKNVLDYEPELALFAPEDEPIIFYQRIGDYAWKSLNPGGALYFELNPLTAEAVGDYLRQIGFQEIEFRQDQFGKQRFLKAKKI